MENTVAMLIENLVSGLLSEMLSHTQNTMLLKIKRKVFDWKLSKWMCQFINGNDGTILTTGDFERYLSHHGPIARIFDAIIGDNPIGAKEPLIENLIIRFKEIRSEGKTTTYQDEMVLKDLFDGIYERIDRFYHMQLSDSDRYIIAKLQKAETIIIDSQKASTAEIKQDISKITEVLREGKQIKAEDAHWIYRVIEKMLEAGNAEAIHVLLPLLNENTGDLQYVVPYMLKLMSNIDVSARSFAEVQKHLKDETICSDVVRKTIYYSLIADNIEVLNQVGTRNTDLKSIAENLVAKNYDVFFIEAMQNQNGINTITIKVQNNYPDEMLLVLRICAFISLRYQVRNSSDVVDTLLGKNQTIIDKILYYERKSIELQSSNCDNTDIKNNICQEMENACGKVISLPEFLQIKFFASMLRISISLSAGKGQAAVNIIPQNLRNKDELELLCMQVEIMNGKANLNQVVQLCVQSDQYWLFNNYLLQFKTEPMRMREIIENHKFILDKDVSIFLIYVQLISITEGKDTGKVLLESYEKKYSNYLEYWVEKVNLCDHTEALEVVEYIQSATELLSCSPQVRTVFIQQLYDFDLYDATLCEIEREETYFSLTGDLVYIKAMSLLKTKKEIKALDTFNILFDLGWDKDEIIFYVIVLSNKNNREIDETVLKAAVKSNSAKVLLCLSNYYERHQDLNFAEMLLLRSMFHGDEKLPEVYGNYLRLHSTVSAGQAVECEISNVNTMVRLISESKKTEMVYCIHGSEVLPAEPFEWEGGNHIYKDTAIRLGLYRKKVGDTVVLEDISYTIAELLTLDCYLFRLSMQKIIDAGQAKCIQLPVDDQGKFDTEAFKNELLENIGEPDDEQQWLHLYRDMSALPVTIFFAEKFVRVNYLHLTLALLQDADIIMRELTGRSVPNSTKFILSFTALIALHEIGFSIENCSADLTIAASSLKEIDIEAEQIVSDNSRDHVASMGIHNGQLYFSESSETAKQEIMQKVMLLKSFAHQFATIDNNRDLKMDDDPQFDCKEFFGICDYDTIAIATESKRTVVTFEAVITAFAGFPGVEVSTVGLADFLANVCNDAHKLVDYVQKMLEYRFMLPFSSATIQKLSELYKMLPEQEQVIISKKWEHALSVPLHDEKYKNIIAEQARTIYLQIYEKTDLSSPICKLFTKYSLIYLGYRLQWNLSPKGKIAIRLVASEGTE